MTRMSEEEIISLDELFYGAAKKLWEGLTGGSAEFPNAKKLSDLYDREKKEFRATHIRIGVGNNEMMDLLTKLQSGISPTEAISRNRIISRLKDHFGEKATQNPQDKDLAALSRELTHLEGRLGGATPMGR